MAVSPTQSSGSSPDRHARGRILAVCEAGSPIETALNCFEREGFDVSFVPSAFAAAVMHGQQGIDVLIVDGELLHLNDFELFPTLRKACDPERGLVPYILVCLSSHDPSKAQKALDAGADCQLLHPFRASHLRGIVRRTLRRLGNQKPALIQKTVGVLTQEISSPLAGIANALLLIDDAIPQDHPHRKYVTPVQKAVERMTKAVQEILSDPQMEHLAAQHPYSTALGAGETEPRPPTRATEAAPQTRPVGETGTAANDWIGAESSLLDALDRAVNLSARHGRRFTICRFTVPEAGTNGQGESVRQELRKGKRNYDIIAMDPHGDHCFLLLETNREGGQIVCDRIQDRLRQQLGIQVAYRMAAFPEDGESVEALLANVENGRSGGAFGHGSVSPELPPRT